MIIGLLAWIVRSLLKPRRPVVKREMLKPGETIVISNLPAKGRRRSTKSDTST